MFSAPCELPAIIHGQYLLGYRAGLTIANGSFVTFQCDPEFVKTTSVSIECVLGRLVPKVPSCKRGDLNLCTHYMTRIEFIENID